MEKITLWQKRAVVWLVLFGMMLGLVPAVGGGITAVAEDDTKPSIQTGMIWMDAWKTVYEADNSATLADIDKVYMGTYDSKNILWVPLYVPTADVGNSLILFPTSSLVETKFNTSHNQESYYQYQKSALHKVMEDLYTGNKLGLSAAELSILMPTKLDAGSMDYRAGDLYDQYFYPLSKLEFENSVIERSALAGVANGISRYWLRTKESFDAHDNQAKAYFVYAQTGEVGATAVSVPQGVRPAVSIRGTNVLFASAAQDGKAAFAGVDAPTLTAVPDTTTSEWKMTVQDTSRSFALMSDPVMEADNVISFTYAGAATGANEYISVMIMDSTDPDTVLYYGKVKNLHTLADAMTNTASFTLPAGITGNITLKIFNEQANGDYQTDYASNVVTTTMAVGYDVTVVNGQKSTISITGKYPAGTRMLVSANAPAAGEVFDTWACADTGIVFDNATSSAAWFTMPARDVTVTATYKDDPNTYQVTMADGQVYMGAEWGTTGFFGTNVTVPIQADATITVEGNVCNFETWQSDNTAVVFSNASSEQTTFTMPARDVTITAVYHIPVANNISAVTQADISYGEMADPQVTFDGVQNGGEVTFHYTGTHFTNYDNTEPPVYVGNYTVTATSAATEDTFEGQVSTTFAIKSIPANITDAVTLAMGDTIDLSTLISNEQGYTFYTLRNGVGSLSGSIYTAPSIVWETPELDIRIQGKDVNGDGQYEYQYYNEYPITISTSSTLYAVSFNAGDGTGTMDDKRICADASYPLPECSFTAPSDLWFKAWEIDGTLYDVGDTYTVTKDTTIKAIWRGVENQPLAFAADSVTKTEGEAAFTNALTGASTTVTYTSGNEKVATVDAETGEVTIFAAGTAIITATADETAEYYAASTSFELVVNQGLIAAATDETTLFEGQFANLEKVVLNGTSLVVDESTGELLGYPGYTYGGGVIGKVFESSIGVTLYAEFLASLPTGTYSLSVTTLEGDMQEETSSNVTFDVPEKESVTLTVTGTYTGGTTNGATIQATGDIITLSAGKRSGYTFAGWRITGASVEDATQTSTQIVVLTEDVIAMATWTKNATSNEEDNDANGNGASVTIVQTPVVQQSGHTNPQTGVAVGEKS